MVDHACKAALTVQVAEVKFVSQDWKFGKSRELIFSLKIT